MLSILIDVSLRESDLDRLRALPQVRLHPLENLSRIDGARRVALDDLTEKQILLCKWPPENLNQATDLKWIQIVTVGYEHLKPFRFDKSKIRVCNARGIFDTAIAEWNLAMMINLVRDLPAMMRNQTKHEWERAPRFAQEIRGKTVGLWGYGGIGRETARLAKTMGMQIHVLTRNGVKPRRNDFTPAGTGDPEGTLPDRVYILNQKYDFLRSIDFLILALPRTQESTGMIGEPELKTLPRHAYLLNPSRGPIVQEAALLKALQEQWIAGAALDTHFAYPLPFTHPLWDFPNVILTPHISGADHSNNYPARIGELFYQNVQRYLQGQPLLNELTQTEWEGT